MNHVAVLAREPREELERVAAEVEQVAARPEGLRAWDFESGYHPFRLHMSFTRLRPLQFDAPPTKAEESLPVNFAARAKRLMLRLVTLLL
jgi:hypothetical protein